MVKKVNMIVGSSFWNNTWSNWSNILQESVLSTKECWIHMMSTRKKWLSTLKWFCFLLWVYMGSMEHFLCGYLTRCLVLLGESGIGKQSLMRNSVCVCVCVCVCPGLSVYIWLCESLRVCCGCCAFAWICSHVFDTNTTCPCLVCLALHIWAHNHAYMCACVYLCVRVHSWVYVWNLQTDTTLDAASVWGAPAKGWDMVPRIPIDG